MAFRQWLHERAGGDVGWAGGVTSADLPPARSRQQLLSRWDRHTQHCASCKQVCCPQTYIHTVGAQTHIQQVVIVHCVCILHIHMGMDQ